MTAFVCENRKTDVSKYKRNTFSTWHALSKNMWLDKEVILPMRTCSVITMWFTPPRFWQVLLKCLINSTTQDLEAFSSQYHFSCKKKKSGSTVLLEFPSSRYTGLNLIHLNMNSMSRADRQHMFFRLKWSKKNRKTRWSWHNLCIQGSVKCFVSLLTLFCGLCYSNRGSFLARDTCVSVCVCVFVIVCTHVF